MTKGTVASSFLGLSLATAFLAVPRAATDRFVQVVGASVPIRVGPSATALIVATARKGDIFALSGEKSGYFEVLLFSGEGRYIPQSVAAVVPYTISVPPDIAKRRELYVALWQADDRATAEADRKYPPQMVDKNAEYQRILDDRYMLDVMHRLSAQPAIYGRINSEGAKALWGLGR